MVALSDQLATREGQAGPGWKSERFVVPLKPGNAGGGKGPRFQMSVRQVESQEIGDEPTTSTDGWETSGDAACQSERGADVSLLRPVRQTVPPGRSASRLRALPRQWRGGGSGWADVHGHRGVRRGRMVGGTGTRTEREDVSTPAGPARVDSEGGRQVASARHSDESCILHLFAGDFRKWPQAVDATARNVERKRSTRTPPSFFFLLSGYRFFLTPTSGVSTVAGQVSASGQ